MRPLCSRSGPPAYEPQRLQCVDTLKIQCAYAGNTVCRHCEHARGRCAQLGFPFTKSFILLSTPQKRWWGGGGLLFFAPKSFVGKYLSGQLQLHTILVVQQGRWVYEGSGLKALWERLRLFN